MSTYGIGKEFSPAGWRDLIDQLLFEGLLVENPNDGRPLIALADPEAVRAIYRGERRLTVPKTPEALDLTTRSGRPRGSAKRERQPAAVGPAAEGLFEALRAWRRAEASRQAVPPYIIFHDQALTDIARARPRDRAALSAIGGVGQGKLDRYGEAVLAVVAGT
jgi:ATP-dependent DNA helicase RecQ